MSRLNKLISSFTAGELTPRLGGRVDLAKYNTGLSTLTNMLISPYGCVYKRPGSKYIGIAESNSTKSRLVPYEYGNNQSYILEFSENYIRFIRNQGIILFNRQITDSDFSEGISGFDDISTGTGTISWDSSNERLNLNGIGVGDEAIACTKVIRNIGVGTYTVTVDVGTNDITYLAGTTQGTSGLGSGTLTVGTSKTFTFTTASNSDCYLSFSSTNSAYIDNISISQEIYKINHPYSLADLDDLRFVSSFDTIYIAHGSHPVRKLVRYDNDSWELSAVNFIEPAWMDQNVEAITLTPSAVEGTCTFTASSEIFASTDVGRAIRYKAGQDRSSVVVYTGTGSQTYFDIPFYPQTSDNVVVNFIEANGQRVKKNYVIAVSPSIGEFTITTNGQVRTGDTASTSQQVEISPANTGSGTWGWATITSYISPTSVITNVEETLSGTNASTEWRLGAWSETTGYPKVAILHDQRLYLANTDTQPQYFWASKVGVYTDFKPDNAINKGDIDSDTAFSFALGDSVSQSIQWLASKSSLIIGSTNAVFSARGSQGAISAGNINVKKESDVPCEFAEPALTQNEVLFLERQGRKVYAIAYSFQIDGYEVQDISILSEHIGQQSKIIELAYNPTLKILWARLNNGEFVSCTYLKSQDVIGWARHNIGGTDAQVESIASVVGSTYQEIWMCVKRTIGGVTVRYLDVLQDEFIFDDKEHAYFSDSHLIYDGALTSSISGLGHLEGESVVVLVDGAAHPNRTVVGGAITLAKAGSVVIIGLGYTAELETLSVEVGSQVGSGQSQIVRTKELAIKFFETIGAEYGYTESELDPVLFRTSSDSMDSSPDLYTGWKTVAFMTGQYLDVKAWVKSTQPLPMTILSIVFKVMVSDK